jgi:hypothetical protein
MKSRADFPLSYSSDSYTPAQKRWLAQRAPLRLAILSVICRLFGFGPIVRETPTLSGEPGWSIQTAHTVW